MTMPAPNIFTPIGGRRFFLCLVCALGFFLLMWNEKISDTIFSVVILGTVGGFITGNVIQKVKEGE